MGVVMTILMGTAYYFSGEGLASLMMATGGILLRLVAFGFLGMGPGDDRRRFVRSRDRQRAVGVELSLITEDPNAIEEIKKANGFNVDFEKAKHLLEENDGAGNTFKATAKPVLIGTAVVGATTMIFSIVVLLTHGLTDNMERLSILHPPFLLGMIMGAR